MVAFILATGISLSPVTILTRYSLPAAPVFLALIALFFSAHGVKSIAASEPG